MQGSVDKHSVQIEPEPGVLQTSTHKKRLFSTKCPFVKSRENELRESVPPTADGILVENITLYAGISTIFAGHTVEALGKA